MTSALSPRLAGPEDQPAVRADMRRADGVATGWAVSTGQIPYPAAVAAMEARALAIAEGRADELVWLLEHPPLYTAGVSAKAADLLAPGNLPVFESPQGRPVHLSRPGPAGGLCHARPARTQARRERLSCGRWRPWIIDALASFNVVGEVRPGRVGVWVDRSVSGGPRREEKIAAIGVRLRRWVSFHGISLNVEPDLSHFAGIVPCGLREHGVTSLVDLGLPVTLDEADAALKESFARVFGAVLAAAPPAFDEAACEVSNTAKRAELTLRPPRL